MRMTVKQAIKPYKKHLKKRYSTLLIKDINNVKVSKYCWLEKNYKSAYDEIKLYNKKRCLDIYYDFAINHIIVTIDKY